MSEILIALLPLLLLVACLVAGHYPGYETIVRLAERFAARLRSRVRKTEPQPVAPDVGTATGGLLIALGLAQRPPPPALA